MESLPDLIHALSQPLTSLCCALETTLLQPRDTEQYRQCLRESLVLAEEVRELTCGIRELVAVEHSHPKLNTFGFDALLRDVVSDLRPLAASKNIRLRLSGSCKRSICWDAREIRTATIYLIASAIGACDTARTLVVHRRDYPGYVALEIRGHRESSARKNGQITSRNWTQALIAQRIFERAGGDLEIAGQPTDAIFRGRLPLPSAQSSRPSRLKTRRRRTRQP